MTNVVRKPYIQEEEVYKVLKMPENRHGRKEDDTIISKWGLLVHTRAYFDAPQICVVSNEAVKLFG